MRLPAVRPLVSTIRALPRPQFVPRSMSSVSEFVAAAVRAEPSLAGSSEKDAAAISKLEADTESMIKDHSVRSTILWL